MNPLEAWNQLAEADAIDPVLACCGSRAFAAALVRHRPFPKPHFLLAKADQIWWSLSEADWLEAFACHPRIGESASGSLRQFSAWSTEEQSKAASADQTVLRSIAEKNLEYEARHGFLYIVCANGKSAEELLGILERRIANARTLEVKEAAEQQRQITHIRVRKWLSL